MIITPQVDGIFFVRFVKAQIGHSLHRGQISEDFRVDEKSVNRDK